MQTKNKMGRPGYLIGRFLVFIALTSFFYYSCDEIDSEIPDVRVSINIDLSLINDLTVPGNSVFFPNVGYGGLIVYCLTEGSYYAFDATCTNEINPSCRVENDGLAGKCSCCESEYVFVGGYPTKGPAVAPLKQYQTSFFGNNLRVYN